MSKTGDTKRKIVELLEQKNETLTDISNKLDLAPSTVSQHLQELVDAGTIRLVEDRPRKWKYYEISGRYPNNYQNSHRAFDIRRAVPIAVIAIVLVAAFTLFGSNIAGTTANAKQVYLAPGASIPAGSTVFSVSDAPTFYNISALIVTVDSAKIHSKTTNKWYNVPLQTSTFNLIQLKNISSVLSGVKLSSGTYDDLVLNISNITADVNGTTQKVILPTGKIYIVGNFNISNSTTNWINIDFDLAHSLHITADGRVVMLPVINIRHVNDENLQLSQSSIIIARAPGRVNGEWEYGMNMQGNMINNFSAPQNISVGATSNGKVDVIGNNSVPIIIRTRSGLIIGGDASGLMNVTGPEVYVGFNSTNSSAIAQSCIRKWPSANATANYTSTNVTATSNIAFPIVGECCYPIYVKTSLGKVYIRRCIRLPVPIGRRSHFGVVPIGLPGSYINVTANGLNNGIYTNQWINNQNGSQINIVMPGQNGNFSTQCIYQNGALSCNGNQTMTGIPNIASRIVGSVNSGGVAVTTSQNVIAATGKSAIVNASGNGIVNVGTTGIGGILK
jgi:DNA-binding transcriptional ArsR family regulator